ncbi:MAG TPA: VanZ family protein [Bacteroidales bacterium]|nr:VanZ family protein [Bacteroidales bacterium]
MKADIKKYIEKYQNISGYFFWIWLLVLLILSSIPNIPTQHIDIGEHNFRLDYIFHAGAYGLLTILLHVWRSVKYRDSKNYLLVMLMLLIVLAISDEFHQLLIPGRSFNPVDLYCNIGGILAGTIVFILQ